jgi:hypothetical protein
VAAGADVADAGGAAWTVLMTVLVTVGLGAADGAAGADVLADDDAEVTGAAADDDPELHPATPASASPAPSAPVPSQVVAVFIGHPQPKSRHSLRLFNSG